MAVVAPSIFLLCGAILILVPNCEGQLGINATAIFQRIQETLGLSPPASAGEKNSASAAGNALLGERYRGSGVGPFFLFRSSADNAEIVNEKLKGLPLSHALGLALGDEFPKIRDEFIEETKKGSGLRALTNFQNWRFDRQNRKKEVMDPYIGTVRGLVTEIVETFLPGSSDSGTTVLVDDAPRVKIDDEMDTPAKI